VIDPDGYRANVGIILSNWEGFVLWCKRVGQEAWQFPQVGILGNETPQQAMFRELWEETGLLPEHVEVIGWTRNWLRYELPQHLIRRNKPPRCIGQKQVWFMLRLIGHEGCVRLDCSVKPEFDRWRWVDYWYPLDRVVFFKRQVYWRALSELAPLLFPSGQRSIPSEVACLSQATREG
jgi:putative (di)nucleoside polyphosphate hydrolase